MKFISFKVSDFAKRNFAKYFISKPIYCLCLKNSQAGTVI